MTNIMHKFFLKECFFEHEIKDEDDSYVVC